LNPEKTTYTTGLGNWYANILYLHRAQYFLFVNDLSRLAVVSPRKETKTPSKMLTQCLPELLKNLKIPDQWIQAEILEMTEVHYIPTQSRSVLGTMNDYKFQMEAVMFSPDNALEMSINLCNCPAGPLQYEIPVRVAFNLLQQRFGTSA
jgi:hypothetical protein